MPTLERIVAAGHRVLAVFTQPDRPKGRGGQLTASPVKEAALRLGSAGPSAGAHPPSGGGGAAARSCNPDAMVVVGYGQIIPQAIIDIPPHGIINVHASLLPKYRGAAPIQWAIAHGETRTGVTTMRIDAGLDTGDMLLKWETEIGPEENAVELGRGWREAGADLLVQTLTDSQPDPSRPSRRTTREATLAPILKKEDGQIDWNWPARKILNRVRGFLPWPGAYSFFRGQLFHIWKARVSSEADRRPARPA